MAELQPNRQTDFTARADQPLIGVIEEQDGQEVVRCFTDKAQTDEALGEDGNEQALSLAGAWFQNPMVGLQRPTARSRSVVLRQFGWLTG